MYPTLMRQSEGTAARRRIPIWLVDATDGIAAETGVTGTPRIAKNGVSSAAATASIVQVDVTNMPGLYYLELTAAELDTLGQVFVSFKTAATAQWHGIITVVDYDPFDTVRMGLTALPNAAAEAAGGLYTRGTGAGQISQQTNGQIDVNLERVRNAVLNALVGSRMDSSVGAMAADVITAAAIAAGAIGVSEAPNLDAAITSRATPAQVNTEVSDVLKTDTIAELGVGIPAATPTFETAIMALYMLLRNKLDIDASFKEVHNDAGVIVFKKALTDDATTYSEAEAQSG